MTETRPAWAAGTVSLDPVRAVVLIDHPIQHFAPALRTLTSRSDVRVRAYYWHDAADGMPDPAFGRHVRWNVDLHSGYDWWAPPAGRSRWHRTGALLRELRRHRPELILCFGWHSPIARLGILFARLTGTPLLYYGDTNGRIPTRGWRGRLRRLVLRRLFRWSAGAISTGTFNHDFYLAHGMSARHIHPGVVPTDVEEFRAASTDRSRAGTMSDRPLVIGFAGKFVPSKGLDDLVRAAAELPRDRRWALWVIGDGPQRPDIERLVTRFGLDDRVWLLGFRNTDELPALMGSVDIMVMPSRQEPRGLVAVEAMAAGAATVVSSATGLWGTGDVVAHEHTGLVYPAGDVAALTAVLRRLIDDPDLRTRLASAGQERALAYGPRQFAASTAVALASTARRYRG